MNNGNQRILFKFPEKMYDVDPDTGKVIPLPLGRPVIKNTIQQASKQSPLRPLKPEDFRIPDSNNVAPKRRKVDVPSTSRRLFDSRKTMSKKRESKVSNSPPLLNLETVERKILQAKHTLNGYPFKSPVLKNIKFSRLANSKKKSKDLQVPGLIIEEPEVGEDINSTEEFSNLEQMCTSSPVTSICNLMQDTVLNNDEKTVFSPSLQLTNCIKNIEQTIKEENERHATAISRLNQVLLTLRSVKEQIKYQNKENSTGNRRSQRLQKKSPIANGKLETSPAISKNEDLRKLTLKKNLAAQNAVATPRSKSAMDLYNSIKAHSFSTLETPKSDKRTPNNFMLRLQTQCISLQHTPADK